MHNEFPEHLDHGFQQILIQNYCPKVLHVYTLLSENSLLAQCSHKCNNGQSKNLAPAKVIEPPTPKMLYHPTMKNTNDMKQESLNHDYHVPPT